MAPHRGQENRCNRSNSLNNQNGSNNNQRISGRGMKQTNNFETIRFGNKSERHSNRLPPLTGRSARQQTKIRNTLRALPIQSIAVLNASFGDDTINCTQVIEERLLEQEKEGFKLEECRRRATVIGLQSKRGRRWLAGALFNSRQHVLQKVNISLKNSNVTRK